MHNEAVVVLERGTALPPWMDAELGAESSIFVRAEGAGEAPSAFATRVTEGIERGELPRRARMCVLVVGDDSGRERTLARGAMLISLWELGRVIVLSESTNLALEQLAAMYDAELRIETRKSEDHEEPISVRRVA